MSTIQPNGDESQPSPDAFFPSPEGGLILIRTTRQELTCFRSTAPLMKAVNSSTKQVVFYKPPCKQWDCEVCAPRNAYKARLRAIKGYEYFLTQGRKIAFLTLTPHEKLSSAASIPVMAHAWDNLNRRVKHETTGHEYFLIPETHKSKKLHFHALTTAELPKKWWKNNGRECGMGYQNDLQEVDDAGGVGGYLTKYLTKMLQNSNFPKGFRRIRTSKNWPSLPEMPKIDGWQFVALPRDYALNEAIKSYRDAGQTVVMADANSLFSWLELWAG